MKSLSFFLFMVGLLVANSAGAVSNPKCFKLLTYVQAKLGEKQGARRIGELKKDNVSILNINGDRVKKLLMREMSEGDAEYFIEDVVAFYSPKNDVAHEYIAIDYNYPLKVQAAQLMHENMHRRWDKFMAEVEANTEAESTILNMPEMNVKQVRLYNLIHEIIAHTYEAKHFPGEKRKPTVYEVLNQVQYNYSTEKSFEIVLQWLYLVSRLEDIPVGELKIFHMVRISTLVSYEDVKSVRSHPDWVKFRRKHRRRILKSDQYNWVPQFI